MWPKPVELTSILSIYGSATWMNLASIGQAIIEEKKFENIESDELLGPR